MTSSSLPLLIASDHAGFDLKEAVQKLLSHLKWEDLGPASASPSVDYPDFAAKLARRVVTEKRMGVLICGSGIGMSIAANRIKGVRAALVENPVSARLAREHNHANVLCLGARFVAAPYAGEMIRAWLEATPNTETRHQARVDKLESIC